MPSQVQGHRGEGAAGPSCAWRAVAVGDGTAEFTALAHQGRCCLRAGQVATGLFQCQPPRAQEESKTVLSVIAMWEDVGLLQAALRPALRPVRVDFQLEITSELVSLCRAL